MVGTSNVDLFLMHKSQIPMINPTSRVGRLVTPVVSGPTLLIPEKEPGI